MSNIGGIFMVGEERELPMGMMSLGGVYPRKGGVYKTGEGTALWINRVLV